MRDQKISTRSVLKYFSGLSGKLRLPQFEHWIFNLETRIRFISLFL